MKQAGKKFGFQKVWLLGALALPLAGCGSTGTIPFPTHFSAGISVDDSVSQITVTKTFTPAAEGTLGTPAVPPSADNPKGTPAVPGTPSTPAKTSWAVGTGGAAKFVFTSRPGSDAGYITSYRLTSDIINGQETIDQNSPLDIPLQKMNLYIPSGYTCAAVSASQSCNAADPATVQANGVPSAPFSLDLAGGLANLVIATNASVSRSTTIEFLGMTSRNENFVIKTQVNTRAIKTGDE